MDKIMYRAEDIAEDLSIPPEEAEKLLKGLAGRMEGGRASGHTGDGAEGVLRETEGCRLPSGRTGACCQDPAEREAAAESGGVLRVCRRHRHMHRKEAYTAGRRGKTEAPAMLQHGGAGKELRRMIRIHQSTCIITEF